MTKKRKIIIGVTGASGAMYAQLLLKKMNDYQSQIHESAVIFSDNARKVWDYELENNEYLNLPFQMYAPDDFFSPVASGSSGFDTMIIIPCSMGTLGKIANGISDNLITRAADVMLKERKKLILVIREMPFNLIQLENMKTITLAGGIICPASPSFYSKPKDMNELINSVINKILELSSFDTNSFRWGIEK